MEGKENINSNAAPESTPWDQMVEDLNKLNELKAMFGEEQVPLEAIEKAKLEAAEKEKFEEEQRRKFEEEQRQKFEAEQRQKAEAEVRASQILDEQEAATAADVASIMDAEAAQAQNEAAQAKNEAVQAQNEAAQAQNEAAQVPNEAPETAQNQPLVAINADWTHDRKEIARDLAEQTLNAETAKGNIITKIWKGNLFKKYYEQKYTSEFFKDQRTNPDGKTVTELIRAQNQPAMERFLLSAVNGDKRYVHEKAGESLERADEKTETAIREAIEKYARRSLYPGEKVKDLTRELYNDIDRVMAEASDENGDNAKKPYDKRTNYLEVAKQAAERYKEIAANAKSKEEHDLAMAQVMAGFRVYNAEVRDGVRTQAHRDNIDKIVNKYESSKFGRFIPAEIVAGAAGAAVALTQTGARAVAGAAGGIIASSAIAGLKERNRVTEDRSRMMRDVANGLEYGNSEDKRIDKHELRLGGTLYDMQPASELTSRIQGIIDRANNGERGIGKELLQAIAEARVRIDFSDSEQKDLISYSSDQNRGRERLELDKVLFKAERALSEKDKKNYEALKDQIKTDLIEGYEDAAGEYHEGILDKDDEFKNYRTIAAVKTAGKTLALGGAFFFVSQEVMAAIDPAKIGVFEKAGLLKTANNEDAKETVLASGFGLARGKYETIVSAAHPSDPVTTSDPAQIRRLESAGYSKTEISAAWSKPESTLVEVDPSASTAQVDLRYDGWASGGTRASGNELRTAVSNGRFISNMTGQARLNGQTLNYDPASVRGYLTVGDAKFEIAGRLNEAGQMTWGENGIFTTTTGETIKALGDNGEKLYKYFEVAVDNGVDSDGVKHVIALATDTGANTFADKISQVVETTVEHPAVYQFTKMIPEQTESVIRDVNTSGFAFAPNLIFGTRTGLGEARQNNESQNTASATESAPESPETAPEANLSPELEADLAQLAELNRQIAEREATLPESIRTYDDNIRARADLLGPVITDALLSYEDYDPSFGNGTWNAAVDSLSPEGLEALRELQGMRYSIPSADIHALETGNAFRAFLAYAYPEL